MLKSQCTFAQYKITKSFCEYFIRGNLNDLLTTDDPVEIRTGMESRKTEF